MIAHLGILFETFDISPDRLNGVYLKRPWYDANTGNLDGRSCRTTSLAKMSVKRTGWTKIISTY